MMNSAIILLKDGSPCFVHDDGRDIRYMEFSAVTMLLTLVHFNEDTQKEERVQLEYPIDSDLAALIKKYKLMSVGRMNGEKVEDIYLVGIKLTED